MVTMECLLNGSLADVPLKAERNQAPAFWTHTQIAIILGGILHGIAYIHAQDIVHGGLKLSDTLLDRNNRPRISDYATSIMA
jgi:serine/threonine protein kinase